MYELKMLKQRRLIWPNGSGNSCEKKPLFAKKMTLKERILEKTVLPEHEESIKEMKELE